MMDVGLFGGENGSMMDGCLLKERLIDGGLWVEYGKKFGQ